MEYEVEVDDQVYDDPDQEEMDLLFGGDGVSISSYLSGEFRLRYGDVDIKQYQRFSTLTTARVCLIAAYSSLFVIGLVGNFWVACVHGSVWRYNRQQQRSSNFFYAPRAVQIYILSLCLCDLLVLGFVSALISDLFYGQWIVPSVFLCRLYLTSESVNRFYSPFLLAAMSGYCYFSISKTTAASSNSSNPNPSMSTRTLASSSVRRGWNDTKTAVLLVLSSTVIVLLLVSPVYIYGDLYYVVFVNDTRLIEIYQKCAFEPPPLLLGAFTIYSCIGGYVILAASFTLFYIASVYRVRVRAPSMRRRRSNEYFGRVARTTTGLVTFYLVCWTPYWCLMLYQFATTDEDVGPPSITSVVFGLLIHILPYINCSGYPILYTVMNR